MLIVAGLILIVLAVAIAFLEVDWLPTTLDGDKDLFVTWLVLAALGVGSLILGAVLEVIRLC